jgi:plastocyanin
MEQPMKNLKGKATDRHRKPHRQRIRLALWPGVLIVLMAGLSACAAPAGAGQSTQTPATAAPTQAGRQVEVVMRNITYMPQEITVPPGTTVVWTNEDSFEHTVTSGTRGNPSGLFDQSAAAGASFSFTFDEPGTYNYYCRIHSTMNGTVIVKEGASLPSQTQQTGTSAPQSGTPSGGSY